MKLLASAIRDVTLKGAANPVLSFHKFGYSQWVHTLLPAANTCATASGPRLGSNRWQSELCSSYSEALILHKESREIQPIRHRAEHAGR
jgi:hypothetical protein